MTVDQDSLQGTTDMKLASVRAIHQLYFFSDTVPE